jgi:outer membrane protein assembly factor BamB
MRPTAWRGNGSLRTYLLGAAVFGIVALFLIPSTALGGSVPTAAKPFGDSVGGLAPAVTAFHTTVVKSSADDWPELHQTPLLQGYVPGSPLSAPNASKLGVAWATDLYGAALDSPVVAYNPTLGETLAYVGTETGNVLAINLANGQIVWGAWVGSPIRSSLLENDGALYVATFTTDTVFKFNDTTGGVDCSLINSNPFEATPTFATPPGGVPTLFLGGLDTGPTSAAFFAMNASNCAVEWRFTGYNQTAGSWSSASYAVTKSGVPLVLFGTDNPDSSVYALNALTGKEVWRFQCYNPGTADFDVAAGTTISPPGKNGFTQGVAYAVNKAGRAYALDLNNGTLIWETNFDALAGITGVARSTPALDGTSLVFGFAKGLYNLDAITGAATWEYVDPSSTESIAAPAIAGDHGNGIAVTGDVAGTFDVVAMVGGAQLYTYQTGGYFTGSPALSGGNIVISSADGFLYDFSVGGGNDAVLPSATVTSPAQAGMLPNPNGNQTVSGSATDPKGVAEVEVAVQSSGTGGPWWDASTGTWSSGPVDNLAALVSPGATSTAWSLPFPVPRSGGTYEVTAYAVSTSGQSGASPSSVEFSVNYSTSGPYLHVSTTYIAPGSDFTVTGGGFGASENVRLQIYGKTVKTVKTKSSGVLPSTEIVLSATAAFGQTSVTAHGETSGKSTSAPIVVANNWSQLGDGPGHVGFEANDPVLNLLIFPGGDQWVTLAWHFDAGVPINASPVILDGVAYVADTAGQLFAVDTHNGGLLWTFTLASGAAINGTPALDSGLGLAVVGSADGTVDAVYLSNGTLDWSHTVGGNVSAPTLDSGILYVTSTSHVVEALAESNGAVIWKHTLSSSVLASPTLNASAHLLVVGESNGDVLGLNASTGATRWTYVTGGAVTASAMVTGGIVYVGSNDHSYYAINQSTGSLHWSFLTRGAVQDTGTLDNQGLLYIGSDDGTLYVLRANTGKQDFNFSIGSPIVGVSTAKGVAVYETAGGTIGAEKTFVNGGGWRYKTGAGLGTAPVLLDGAVYVCAEDGSLYAFTATGQPPN